MGLCETVKSLAEAVARAKQPENPRHRLLVEILRLMPLYRDIGKLSAWDTAFRGALEEKDDESELGQILFEVFDFGRYNLYGKFDVPGTLQAHQSLCEWLEMHDVPVPASLGLADW